MTLVASWLKPDARFVLSSSAAAGDSTRARATERYVELCQILLRRPAMSVNLCFVTFGPAVTDLIAAAEERNKEPELPRRPILQSPRQMHYCYL